MTVKAAVGDIRSACPDDRFRCEPVEGDRTRIFARNKLPGHTTVHFTESCDLLEWTVSAASRTDTATRC